MSDAVALFRPSDPDALTPFLDLDEDSEESEGIYAEALEDGAWLLHTFQPFELFAGAPEVAHAWLAQFGPALAEVHADPRGLLFFPDSLEPEAATYEGVVTEIADAGIWVSPSSNDMQLLEAIAGQLFSATGGGGGAASSFEIGRLLGDAQANLFAALQREVDGERDGDGDVVDAEAVDTDHASVEPKKPTE